MSTIYRYGTLIPTTGKVHYISNIKSFDSDQNDYSEFEKSIREKAGNPPNYNFSNSDPFETEEECHEEKNDYEQSLINDKNIIKHVNVD